MRTIHLLWLLGDDLVLRFPMTLDRFSIDHVPLDVRYPAMFSHDDYEVEGRVDPLYVEMAQGLIYGSARVEPPRLLVVAFTIEGHAYRLELERFTKPHKHRGLLVGGRDDRSVVRA